MTKRKEGKFGNLIQNMSNHYENHDKLMGILCLESKEGSMPVLDHCVIIVGTSRGRGKACLFLSFPWFFGTLLEEEALLHEKHSFQKYPFYFIESKSSGIFLTEISITFFPENDDRNRASINTNIRF